jgi:hypothetical protein
MEYVTYEGEKKDGQRYGYGVLTGNFGSYKGNFRLNKYHGDGILILNECGRFEGQFRMGDLHGHCETDSSDGKFIGEYVNNYPRYGTMIYKDGTKYTGVWKNGMWNGKGEFTDHASVYTGTYKDGVHHGFGEMIFNDGSKYIGNWKDDKLNGKGKYTTLDTEYVGNFKDGLHHGYGKFTDGLRTYKGQFKNNQPNGYGRSIEPNGVKVDCNWINGKADTLNLIILDSF